MVLINLRLALRQLLASGIPEAQRFFILLLKHFCV